METAKGFGTAVAQHTGRRVDEDGIKTEQPKEDQRWDRKWHGMPTPRPPPPTQQITARTGLLTRVEISFSLLFYVPVLKTVEPCGVLGAGACVE